MYPSHPRCIRILIRAGTLTITPCHCVRLRDVESVLDRETQPGGLRKQALLFFGDRDDEHVGAKSSVELIECLARYKQAEKSGSSYQN